MAELNEADLKFVLSVDPDQDALNKAINQINADIDKAQVAKIRMGLEQQSAGPQDALPASFLEKKFGKLGTALDSILGKTNIGSLLQQLTGGMGAGAGAGAAGSAGGTGSGLLGAVIGGAGGSVGGAAAGAAAGGPITIVAALAQELSKVIGQVAASPFKALNAGLSLVSGGLKQMQGPLGPIGMGLDLVGKGFGFVGDMVKKVPVLGELLGPLFDQLAALPGIISEILSSMVSLTAKASPGTVKQFNIALEDAQATMGQAFIPIVNLMTDVVRDLSDMLAAMIPNTEEVSSAMSGLRAVWTDFRDKMKDALTEIGPLIRSFLTGSLKALGVVLSAVANAVVGLTRILSFLLAPIKALLGIESDTKENQRKGTTAARTPFMGSIEEYQRRLQMETAGAGHGGMDVSQNVKSIASTISDIGKWFEKHDDLIRVIAGALWPFRQHGPTRQTLTDAENLVRGEPGSRPVTGRTHGARAGRH